MSTIPIFGTADRLPRHVGGLALTDLEQYSDALAGVRLQYRTLSATPPDNPGGAELTKADSYLYSPQMIVQDMNTADVDIRGQFGAALAQIVEAGKLGYYADVEIVSMEELLIQGDGAVNQWMTAVVRLDTATSTRCDTPIPPDLRQRQERPDLRDSWPNGRTASRGGSRLTPHPNGQLRRGTSEKVRSRRPRPVGPHCADG